MKISKTELDQIELMNTVVFKVAEIYIGLWYLKGREFTA